MKTIKQISSGLWVESGCRRGFRNLKLKSSPNRSAIRVILLSMIFFVVTFEVPGGRPVITEEMKVQTERAFFYYQIRYLPFSEELLIKCLKYEGVKFPDIVLLQSQLETGFYSSDIFLNANNLFGMRYPSRRPTVATGTYKEHAKYAHWSDSVIDYVLWQDYYQSRGYRIVDGGDNDSYLVFLNCIPYAQDPRYISKLVTLSQGDLT